MAKGKWLKGSRTQSALESFEPCETDWLKELSESTRNNYPRYWQEFKEFVGLKASEIMKLRADDMALRRDDPNRWRFEDLAKSFYHNLYKDRQPRNPIGIDKQKLTAAQSFFSHKRMRLEFKRGEIKEPVHTTVKYEYTLQDLEAAKKFGDITERWIFLGGKSLGQRIEVFLDLKIDDIKPLLDEEPPVPINKVSGLKAHPCLDRDALEAARDLVATRSDDNPFMLPGKGGKGKMTEQGVNKAIRRVADLAHRANPRLFRYRERKETARFHGFRAFLNGALQNAMSIRIYETG